MDEDGDYWWDQRVEDQEYALRREIELLEKVYGIEAPGHFHWRIIVVYDDGWVHTSDWHATVLDARRVVYNEAKILREKMGKPYGFKGITMVPLDSKGNPLKEVEGA